jgi:hypothetical protein
VLAEQEQKEMAREGDENKKRFGNSNVTGLLGRASSGPSGPPTALGRFVQLRVREGLLTRPEV